MDFPRTVRRLSVDSPWNFRGHLGEREESYFLATKDSKRIKTVAVIPKSENRKAIENKDFSGHFKTLEHGKNTIGKDEVPGPNPGSSSKKSCNHNGYRIFCFLKLLSQLRRRAGGIPVRRRFA